MKQFIECYSDEKHQQINKLEEDLHEQNKKLARDQSTLLSIKFDLEQIQQKMIDQYYQKALFMEKQFLVIDQTYDQLLLLETKLKEHLK